MESGVEQYRNPLSSEDSFGIEFLLRLIIGEQQIKEFRKNRTYQRILVIIDSVIVYSTYMILWSVLSLFEFVVRHLLLIRAQSVFSLLAVLKRVLFLIAICVLFPVSFNIRSALSATKRFVSSFLPRHPYFLAPYFLLVLFPPQGSLSLSDLSSALLSPISEELLFRQYLCNLIMNRLGERSAIILNSLFFSGLHFLSIFSRPFSFIARQIGLSFLGGMCFSCAMIEGNSVMFSILLHSLNNLVSVLLGSLQMTYFLERTIEGMIMFPIIFYLCKVSQNGKTKSQ